LDDLDHPTHLSIASAETPFEAAADVEAWRNLCTELFNVNARFLQNIKKPSA
jgi:hypothetical protein